MTSALILRPLVPVWVVVLATVLLLGVAAYFLASRSRQRGEWVVRALMVVCVAGILLRPGIGQTASGSQASDLEIMVVVDRTTSMSALDWNGQQPRLEGVRQDLSQLIEEFPGARFSLITFGRFVRTELPFSSDTGAFLAAVETMQPEGPLDGIGSTVSIARDAMEESLERAAEAHPERRRLVVFASDGENTSGAPRESFEGLADLIVGGAVLGYGTVQGGPMPLEPERPDGPVIFDEQTGADALSTMDPETLATIAEELDVAHLHREGPGGLDRWADDIKAGLDRDDGVSPAEHELYWIFALGLFALALAELRIAWRGMLSARRELRSL